MTAIMTSPIGAVAKDFVDFVREYYFTEQFIPLYMPMFVGKEHDYILQTIDSASVSNDGEFVNEFETKLANYVGSSYAVATVNGTAALHTALQLLNVSNDCEVITQSLTFVATCNAIRYCQAFPVFVDIAQDTLGMCPDALAEFLFANTQMRDGVCYNKHSERPIRVCVSMHTYGFPCEVDRVIEICRQYNIAVIEDATQSLGSYIDYQHTGTSADIGIFSFDGDKIITAGCGGMLITDNALIVERAKHLTSLAKQQHAWEYRYDDVGYDYRLPNINAALGAAQMATLPRLLDSKRHLAKAYQQFFVRFGIKFFVEPLDTQANYWLNTIVLEDKIMRDDFLQITNAKQVMTRPTWTPMHKLPIFKNSFYSSLPNTEFFTDRIVNIPSSANLETVAV